MALQNRSMHILSIRRPFASMDTEGVIEYINPKFTELSCYTKDEAIGKTLGILKSSHITEELYQQLWQQIISGQSWQGEIYNQAKDGHLYWVRLLITPIKDESGNISHYLGSMEDITDIKEYEKSSLNRHL